MHECCDGRGTTWTVVSPVVFTYQVIQTPNLLDPSNDVLLTGHIRDAQQLEMPRKSPKPMRRLVVMDETVFQLYGSQVTDYLESRGVLYSILPLPTTEENKSMEMVMAILHEVHKFGIDRRTEPIIAIGGGVCLDIVGLAASLYRRQTPYIRVPTTLLSYIDASVGAKTGVNFASYKNKLICSPGCCAVGQMALMKHRGLFLLDSKFQSNKADSNSAAAVSTRLAIETMLEELAPNLWEDSLDQLVDFGHLISPELEMKVLPALLHGEAVNIDMAFMVELAHERGLLSAEVKLRIINCMLVLELPVWHPDCSLTLIQRAMRERLRHSGGRARMPLPTGLGCAEMFNDTDEEVLCRAYESWCIDLGEGVRPESR